jgi:hypothetical protein
VDNLIAPPSPSVALRAQLNVECELMIAYALSGGKELPQSIGDALDMLDRDTPRQPSLAALTALHTVVSRLVAPATPRGLAAIYQDGKQHAFLHRFGAVPALRYLLFAAVAFSWMFFLTTLTQEINPENVARDIYTSYGWTAGLVLVFLLSAAGMGATFGALFEVYQYVSDGNYDPKYDSIYWVRIGIGLMAGLILAQLIPLPPRDSSVTILARPLLALLGGYSASVVHRILERLVAALEGVFVPKQVRDPTTANRDLQQRVVEEQSRQVRMFDDLIREVVASGGTIADLRSNLVTLLPGGLAPELAGKSRRLALDVGIGLVTGGVADAGEKVVRGAVSNAADLRVAAVEEALSASSVAGAIRTGIAGSAATLIVGATEPAAREGNELSAAAGIASVIGTVSSQLGGGEKPDRPINEVTADVAKTLGRGLLSGSPVGFVSALVSIGCKLDEAQYQRWKARVLAAPYRPEFLPPNVAASAIAAMRLSPIFSRVFKPEMETDDRLKLPEIALSAVGPDEAFRAAFAARFMSEEECKAGLHEFRQVLLNRQVMDTASPLLQDGLSAADVLDAADRARSNPAAAEGLTAVIQTLDRARKEKWDERKAKTEVDALLQSPAKWD